MPFSQRFLKIKKRCKICKTFKNVKNVLYYICAVGYIRECGVGC